MSVFVLSNRSVEEVSNLVEICKSSSGITGLDLRKAHYKLGQYMAPELVNNTFSKEYVIVVLMRAGLCYALGIADKIEKMGNVSSLIFINNNQITDKDIEFILGKNIIIVDAVINTGKSIFKIMNQMPETSNIKIATTVIPLTSLPLFENYNLFTVRTSENQYVGAKIKHISGGDGPDTGDRLFNTF